MNEEDIANKVGGVTGIPISIIRSGKRTPTVVKARWALLYCLRYLYPWLSLDDLAKTVGKVCHVTASYGLRKANELYETDKSFRAVIDAVLDEE